MRDLLFILLLSIPSLAAAGPLADAIENNDEGSFYFSFETREGVWGDGHTLTIHSYDDNMYVSGRHDRWRNQLSEGPGRVWLRIRRGEVVDIELEVGGPEPELRSKTTDLGFIEAGEVQEVMLHLAETTRDGDLDTASVCALVTEDFDDWERLLALARDEDRPEDIRESAIFWLGQEASEVATEGLVKIVEDDDIELELREHAIFSLSQQGIDTAFPALKNVALNSRHPQLREDALFWLAQHDDPRVVDLIEEILLK
jgi:hypothetical protein